MKAIQNNLIPAQHSDFDFFYTLYMHPEVNRYLLYDLMPTKAFKPIYDKLIAQRVLFRYVENEMALGMCKLIFQEHRNSHIIYLGGVAIHPQQAGKGAGYRMLQAVQQHAIEHDRKRIELSVAIENIAAIGLYKKAGFVEEGIFRKFSWLQATDEYLDEMMMAWMP